MSVLFGSSQAQETFTEVKRCSLVAMLAGKAVVTCGPARLSCSCECMGASPEPCVADKGFAPHPRCLCVGHAPALLEREEFCILSDLLLFCPDRPRNLEACSSGCRGPTGTPTLGFAVPALGCLSVQHLPPPLVCSPNNAQPLLPSLPQG